MSAVERLLAIELRLDDISEVLHRLTPERESLQREKSSILICLSWAERQDFERAMVARVAGPLDAVSAVRAVKT